MNTKQIIELHRASDNALALLTRMQLVMGPIAMCGLPLVPHDVKAMHELVRDAAAPLRVALSSLTLVQAPSCAEANEGCQCKGMFHDDGCPLRIS